VIREDREFLTELAQLNGDIPTLALRIMDGSASTAEQTHYAQRLIAVGQRLKRRAEDMSGTVIEGEICVDDSIALPVGHTVEPDRRL